MSPKNLQELLLVPIVLEFHDLFSTTMLGTPVHTFIMSIYISWVSFQRCLCIFLVTTLLIQMISCVKSVPLFGILHFDLSVCVKEKLNSLQAPPPPPPARREGEYPPS
jgi:hypothetical protein